MRSHIAPVRPTNIPRNDITIIILAANIGYGMKTYGPKSLITVNSSETLIEYQINLLKSIFPLSDILLVVGFHADKIIRKCPSGVRIIENVLFETSNEVEQVRLALNCALTSNVLIMKDDIVFNYETLRNITKDKSCIIYDSKKQIDSSNVGVVVVDNYVTFFSYDSPNKWCHIAYLTKKELKLVKYLCNHKERKRMFIFEIFNMMLEKTGKITAIEPNSMKIIKIDSSKYIPQIEESNENSNC